MDSSIKNQIVNHYLSQQISKPQGQYHQPPMDVPTQAELEEFKAQVNIWLDTDTMIKKMKAAVKERKEANDTLSLKILEFMQKFNIEDLNTKEGKLKYRVSTTKVPIARAEIKSRLIENYDPQQTAVDLASKIFDDKDRPVKERHSLRRGK